MPEWLRSNALVPYPEALLAMDERAAAIHGGGAQELVWLLEHPPLYTAGTSAEAGELISPADLPVYRTGRGGRFTYHGPGQRIAYVMLDLSRRGQDLHAYVAALEGWVIAALARFGVRGERRSGRVGVWVVGPGGREDKIAAIGVRVRRWVTLHGVSVNVAPDLAHYEGIVPCGIRERGVTSLARLGLPVAMDQLDDALRATFEDAMPPVR